MHNPLTHKHGQPLPLGLLAYDFVEAGLYGAAIGALGSRIFRFYSVNTGAVIGAIARVTNVIPSRMWSNATAKIYANLEGNPTCPAEISYACYAKQAVWLSPLLARLVGIRVTFGMTVQFWLVTGASALVLWPLKKHVIYKALDLVGVGCMTIDHGFSELYTRPSPPSSQQATLSDANIHLAPSLPPFKDPAELNGVPTLSEMANKCLEEGQTSNIFGKEPADPGSFGKPVDQEFYKIVRNLADHIHRIPDPEQKRRALQRINYAFGMCETRQLSVMYELLAALHADADSYIEQIQLKVRPLTYRLKQEIYQDFATSQGLGAENVHTVAAFTRNCGSELGLIQGDLDPERTFLERNNVDGFNQWLLNRISDSASYDGANKWYWIRAIKARYRAYNADVLIQRVHRMIGEDTDTCNAAQQVLADHLVSLGAKDQDGNLAEAWELVETEGAVTQHYCQARSAGRSGYELNEEGTILLLKLTGDLVNDGQLHTQLTSENILSSSL